MMNYRFFEDEACAGLYPFTLAASASTIRVGILTISEKWACHANLLDGAAINSRLLPAEPVLEALKQYPSHNLLCGNHVLIERKEKSLSIELPAEAVKLIAKPWQIFQWNGSEIQADIKRLSLKPLEKSCWNGVQISGTHPVYAAPDAMVEPGTWLLPVEGPIVLGSKSLVMAGSFIRGNVSIGDHAVVKMGAKIYADTTIGPECRAGGEIQNSVLFEYSNKGHDGYIGNSVIGRWCNLGAGTDTSNLKNNYGSVRVYDAVTGRQADTGLQFCGTLMGDHTKAAIGTTFNTGTVTGIFANVAAGGFPDKYIPSFSWITPKGTEKFDFNKALEMARAMMQRRNTAPSEQEIAAWKRVFEAGR